MAIDTQHPANTGQLFMRLYKSVFPAVARFISRRGGSLDEAKDVFQDALVVYYENTAAGNYPDNEKAYLMGIARHLWIKRYRDNGRYVPIDEAFSVDDVSVLHESRPDSNKILHYLESRSQKCMDLLKSFYYEKLPMADIARTFGFSGERSATVQKFKCLEKVRGIVKSKMLTYDDFVE